MEQHGTTRATTYCPSFAWRLHEAIWAAARHASASAAGKGPERATALLLQQARNGNARLPLLVHALLLDPSVGAPIRNDAGLA